MKNNIAEEITNRILAGPGKGRHALGETLEAGAGAPPAG